MFNSETAREAGRKASSLSKALNGSKTSAIKTVAARANGLKAVELGVANGRPSLGCTCNKEQHNSTCRVYMAQKKRESRARLAETRPKPPLPEVKPDPPKPVPLEDWLLDGIRPRRPEDVGRNKAGNKKRKLFVDRQF